jgi:phosphatidylserine decarboxylase
MMMAAFIISMAKRKLVFLGRVEVRRFQCMYLTYLLPHLIFCRFCAAFFLGRQQDECMCSREEPTDEQMQICGVNDNNNKQQRQ